MAEASQTPTTPSSAASTSTSKRRKLPQLDPAASGREDVRRGATPFERVLRQAMERRRHEASFAARVLQPLVDRLIEGSSFMLRNTDMDAVRFRLLRAGFPSGLRARDFMALKIVGIVLLPILLTSYLLLFSWILNVSLPQWLIWVWTALAIYLGWRLPDVWLAVVTKKRQFEVQMVLPDMIDLITISVEAGLGLYAAIQRVAMRFPNALSEEFLRSLQEVRLGRTHVDSLRDLVRRLDVEDLTIFISSLIQAETLGVAVANVLRAQSERLRDVRRQRAREQAQKAPLKMLFPLVLFIFPALFVVILGPAFLRIMQSGF